MKRPGHHIAREALKNAFRLQKRRKKTKYKLTLRWTAGHIGIEGNEKADCEAKKAASGQTSITKHLPPYLRKPLPTNPSAVTRKHNDDLKKKWKEEWRASTRGKKALRADKTTPSDKFLKSISKANLSQRPLFLPYHHHQLVEPCSLSLLLVSTSNNTLNTLPTLSSTKQIRLPPSPLLPATMAHLFSTPIDIEPLPVEGTVLVSDTSNPPPP